METGKPGLASAPVHISSVAAQTEKRMDIQAPLTAVYIHTVPALSVQPYPQLPAAAQEPTTLHLAMPPLYSKETLPFLTLHIAGGLQSPPGLSLAAAAPAARPKSTGKYVCPHCGRDCMKPSVLKKHLRCHTGERPYPCTTCGVSFKTQSNLYKHKRTQAHARLSSESEQSSLGSLDSMSSSRETHTSSLSLDECSEESGSMEKDSTLPGAEITCAANTIKRQEATLFSKQWETSVSRGKSQSHESTDSGFSESSDHYPSPGSVLPDNSMDCLSESTKEHPDETTNRQTHSEPCQDAQEPKDTVREQEQKTLEERISKLISDNTAVVEDKQLENVRPRKTVLSKQGSIDLPMPYTYKDSFHFDMRISKTQNFGLQRNRKPGLYSSVPTQRSTTLEHAPLTRSNSLPFSVTLLQPERSSPSSFYQSDYVTLVRRRSSSQINSTGFAIKPVNQQSSTHRPLVRQTAVDCNHATDGLFMNSSVEEACTSSLSYDGDGSDICGEPSNRKFRRKKAQKFAYNKWYMYGGGTFKKLYNAEKADLQICLQIISDEQLALIEPQIERQVERSNNIPAVLTCIPISPTAGLIERVSPDGCAAQKELQTCRHGGTPGPSHSTNWRPKQNQVARETKHQQMDGQGDGGVMKEKKNGVIKTDQESGQWGNDESNCRHTVLPDTTKPEGEDRKHPLAGSALTVQKRALLWLNWSRMSTLTQKSVKWGPPERQPDVAKVQAILVLCCRGGDQLGKIGTPAAHLAHLCSVHLPSSPSTQRQSSAYSLDRLLLQLCPPLPRVTYLMLGSPALRTLLPLDLQPSTISTHPHPFPIPLFKHS
ncbi:zinc finger protein 831 [Lates japonicus]|uniref:Zinc finger protein 831 n=1 Tax=Lates japonicus TaxID=270547 RepID=A0AAD3NAQ7_LATJO|nr:zinc finger protein 831 [Lates japonicus]